MTKIARHLAIGLLTAGLSGSLGETVDAAPNPEHTVRVRTGSTAIAVLIERATERSNSFRALIDAIEASNSIVFVEEGKCGRGMRACFVTVTMAGPNRMLWVKVDVRGVDCDLMGLIGHELQHTVEVLGDPSVTNATAMYFFYRQNVDGRSGGPAFETDAAIKAGEAVRAEVRHNGSCSKLR